MTTFDLVLAGSDCFWTLLDALDDPGYRKVSKGSISEKCEENNRKPRYEETLFRAHPGQLAFDGKQQESGLSKTIRFRLV